MGLLELGPQRNIKEEKTNIVCGLTSAPKIHALPLTFLKEKQWTNPHLYPVWPIMAEFARQQHT